MNVNLRDIDSVGSAGWIYASTRAICFVAALVTLAALSIARPAEAQQLVYNGGGVVGSPAVFNVYWDPNWDADNPSMTQAAIDDFTKALCASSYFSGLTQYGVGQPVFVGSVVWSTPPNQTVGDFDLTSLAASAASLVTVSSGQTPLINIFVGSQATAVDVFLFFSQITATSNITAFHWISSAVPFGTPFTVVPVIRDTTFDQLSWSLSHEMVEATTDPDPPFGWLHPWFWPWDTLSNGEAADECESLSATPFLSNPLTAPWQTTQYWSNALNAPTFGFSSMTPPVINSAVITGSGSSMQLTVSGSGFGPPPPDLVGSLPGTNENTRYFQLEDVTTGLLAGGRLNGRDNPGSLNFNSWSNSTIVAGLGNVAGQVSPTDRLSITVWNWTNGQSGSTRQNFTTPVPQSIVLEYPSPAIIQAGTPATFSGYVFDQNGNLLPGTSVDLSVSQGVFANNQSTISVITDQTGNFSAAYKTQFAGVQSVTASVVGAPTIAPQTVTLTILPVVSSMTPDHSPVSGANAPAITISGAGFTPNSQVYFGSSGPATVTSVAANGTSITVKPPADPLSGSQIGRVDVTVSVDGLVSAMTDADRFYFYRPYEPILYGSFDSPADATMPVVVQFWDANGNPWIDPSLPNISLTTSPRSVSSLSATHLSTENSNGQSVVTLTCGVNATVTVTVSDTSNPQYASSQSVTFYTAFYRLIQEIQGSLQVNINQYLQRFPNWQPTPGPQPDPFTNPAASVALRSSIVGSSVELLGNVIVGTAREQVGLAVTTHSQTQAEALVRGLSASVLSGAQAHALPGISAAHYLASTATLVHGAVFAGPEVKFNATNAATHLIQADAAGIEILLPISATTLPAGWRVDVYKEDTTYSPAVWSNAGISVTKQTASSLLAMVPGPGVYVAIATKPSVASQICVSSTSSLTWAGHIGLYSGIEASVYDQHGMLMSGVPVLFYTDHGAFTTTGSVLTEISGDADAILQGARAISARVTAATAGLTATTTAHF